MFSVREIIPQIATQGQRLTGRAPKLPSPPLYTRSFKPTISKEVNLRPVEILKDWLSVNGHMDLAGTISKCGSSAIMHSCGAHNFYSTLFCNSFLCPTCGKEDSRAHKRRIRRTYDKLKYFPVIGNVVLTLPKALKGIPLRDFFKVAGSFILSEFKTEANLSWFHPTGKRLTKHPHIQSLFPVDKQDRYIPRNDINTLSLKWSQVLTDAFPGLDIPERVMIHYCYEDTPAKIAHAVRYVARLAFIKPSQFNALPDDMKHYLAGLRRKRLVRGFGGFADRNLRGFLQEHIDAQEEIEREGITLMEFLSLGGCPCCGQEMGARGIAEMRKLNYDEHREIAPGFYTHKDNIKIIQKRWPLEIVDTLEVH